MKANLTVGLKDLTGKEIVDANGEKILLNKFIANQIVSEEAKENVMQRFELAMKLNVAEGDSGAKAVVDYYNRYIYLHRDFK